MEGDRVGNVQYLLKKRDKNKENMDVTINYRAGCDAYKL